MSLIRQRLLHFQAGTSDKVYEVDLVEVGPDRFVVNFRYGRRGSTLRDGSKTVLPVDRAQAERVFEKLVKSKTDKGYVDQQAVSPVQAASNLAPASTPPPAPREADPRHAALLTRLYNQKGKPGWTLERIIWRAGELRVVGASRAIALLLRNAPAMRVYCIAWSLARLAEPEGEQALVAIAGDGQLPASTRRVAQSGLLRVQTGEALEATRAALVAELPLPISLALGGGDLRGALERSVSFGDSWAEAKGRDVLGQAADAVTLLYMLGADRALSLEHARELPFAPPWFRPLRRLYKLAECHGDDELWGVLARRMDRERSNYSAGSWVNHLWLPRVGRVEVKKELGSDGSRLAFGTGTRKWFRRHNWRALQRLAHVGDAEAYCTMAAGLLLAYSDEDAGEARSVSYYDWSSRGRKHRYYPHYSNAWAFNRVLHDRSTRLEKKGASLLFGCARDWKPGDPVPSAREEAYPQLWNQQPLQLVRLLAASRCAPVHRFAAKALRANGPAWGKVTPDLLRQMFGAPYPDTVELAAEIAVSRFDPRNPDFELVLAVLGCAHGPARTKAAGWVRANPTLFLSQPNFVVTLALHALPETRRLALDLLAGVALPAEVAAEVVQAVIAAALRTTDEASTDILRDAAAVLLTAFSQELKRLPLTTVKELLAHPIEGVAELGAKVLLGHDVRPSELPDDLLADTMTSPFAVVRGIGIRLYGELPDSVLSERYMVLVHLCSNRHPDVRSAARPIVQRLSANETFARQLMSSLFELLKKPLDEGVPEDLVKLVRDHLPGRLATTDQVLDLVNAPATVTQELGGVLLREVVDPSALSVGQAARLGSSDILAVRQACWHILDADPERCKAAAVDVLPLLDAPWEDSREFARRFIAAHFGSDQLGPDLLVALCDSVREEVQAFGREMLTRLAQADQAQDFLLRLSQHPSPSMQLHASASLHTVSGDAALIASLERYFRSVLGRVNTGGVAKKRVQAFLRAEALGSEDCARVVVALLDDLSATCSVQDRAAAIETLVLVKARWPDLDLRLKVAS